MKSVHYSEKKNEFLYRNYRDETSVLGIPTGASFPTQDDAGRVSIILVFHCFILYLLQGSGNPVSFEMGLSTFRDTQIIYLQEMPERAPAGQLPRSVRVYLENDLVDMAKPGDRVRIFGIYRALPGDTAGI